MNLLELLKEHGVPFAQHGESHHVTEGWVGLDCPFCGEEGRYHLGVNLYSGRVNCWKCGPHRLSEVLKELTSLPWGQVQQLIKSVEVSAPQTRHRVGGKLALPSHLGPLTSVHSAYLRGRGHKPMDLAQLWGLKGIGLDAKLAWRIFIPITLHGEVVSWTTRATSDEEGVVRYIMASREQSTISPKDLLYGEDLARHSIVVCEGPMSVWRIGPGAVATLGVSYTKAQLLRMAKYPIRAVCFDNEPGAQRRARDLCTKLEGFPGQTFNVVLDAPQPDQASPKEISQLRKEFLDGE